MDAMQRLKDLAISESGFIFDPYTGSTFTTNSTGRLILNLLKEGKSGGEVRFALSQQFEVGEADLPRDIEEFVSLLRENHLLPRSFTLFD